MVKLLSIAGSDPSGGAGIQMDLKIFSCLGAYGMAVPTALTVQNTTGVFDVFEVTEELLKKQIERVIEDIRPQGVKVGMLGKASLASTVASLIPEGSVVVYDPVLKSTTGCTLTEGEMEELLPLLKRADVITPNRRELLAITGEEDIQKAVEVLRKKGVKAAVVVTGGDEDEERCVDYLCVEKDITPFEHERIPIDGGTHGTGCAFSSALLYFLITLGNLKEAYLETVRFMEEALKCAEKVGRGLVPVRPEATNVDAERFRVLERLKRALDRLKDIKKVHLLIPEVQSNLGEAIPGAKSIEDVAAFPGRIVRFKDTVATLSCPEFGASSHVARIILTAMKFDQSARACMNIKYKKEWIEKLKKSGIFCISQFSRKEEPLDRKKKEGKTLDWGTEVAIKRAGKVPDIIYDEGDVGKEPMIRVLGRSALDVVEKVEKIARLLFKD